MTLERIGLVVHPARDVSEPRDALLEWARRHDVEVVALGRAVDRHDGLPLSRPEICSLVAAIGGDGTVLGAARIAAASAEDPPVLGIACGSLGMLAGTRGSQVLDALDRFADGRWVPRPLDGLRVVDETGAEAVALNDVVVVRKGAGQVKVEVLAGGERYVRIAGDGVIVSTAVGSSAYGMAAGGPILAPGCHALVVTPLAMHGGTAPSLVIPAATPVRLLLEDGFSGRRTEVDGQLSAVDGDRLDLELRPAHVTLVAFEGSEPYLTGLRRRSIVVDSPRIVAHDTRMATEQPQPARGPSGPAPEAAKESAPG